MKLTKFALLAIRIVAGIAAVVCLFSGLWCVFGQPTKGLVLIGLGIVLGVVFGRVPATARESGTRV